MQIRISEERADQARRLARTDPAGAVPEAQLGGAGVLPRQLRPGVLGGARRGRARDRRAGPHGRVRRRPDPGRRPAGRPGLRPLATGPRPAAAGRGDPRTRAVQPPSRALRMVAGLAGRPRRLAGGGLLRGQGAAHPLRRVVRPQHLARGALRHPVAVDRRSRPGEVRVARPAVRGRPQQPGRRLRRPRRRLRDRRGVPLRRPVDDAAGRLPRPADDAPPARPRRRGLPGEEPRGVEVEDARRGHRDPPTHRAQPARRDPGPAGRPGDAARPGQGEARALRRRRRAIPPIWRPSGAWSTRRTAAPRRRSPTCGTWPGASTRRRSTPAWKMPSRPWPPAARCPPR